MDNEQIALIAYLAIFGSLCAVAGYLWCRLVLLIKWKILQYNKKKNTTHK